MATKKTVDTPIPVSQVQIPNDAPLRFLNIGPGGRVVVDNGLPRMAVDANGHSVYVPKTPFKMAEIHKGLNEFSDPYTKQRLMENARMGADWILLDENDKPIRTISRKHRAKIIALRKAGVISVGLNIPGIKDVEPEALKAPVDPDADEQ